MIDPATRHLWIYRSLFVVLGLLLIALKLMPLGLAGATVPAPDFLIALCFAWLLRQPAVVPIGAIVLVFLLADFLFQRPPGLWTLLVLLASESLRRRRARMTELPFFAEWAIFAGAVMALLVANRVALWILMVDQTSLGLTLAHGIVTVAIYPLVVAVSKFVFGLRKMRPTEPELA